jgi:predicted dehydrogenase
MHQTNFQNLPPGLVEIRGVCSRTLESAETFAHDSGVTFATDNLEALLAREDINVIDICTPPASHHEIAIKAAEAGKQHNNGKATYRLLRRSW